MIRSVFVWQISQQFSTMLSTIIHGATPVPPRKKMPRMTLQSFAHGTTLEDAHVASFASEETWVHSQTTESQANPVTWTVVTRI